MISHKTPTLGFRKQERMLRTGSTGGCLRSIAQRTRSGACSYWIGSVIMLKNIWTFAFRQTVHFLPMLSVMSYPFPSSRRHLSCDDCLADKREDNWNCSVLHCRRQLYSTSEATALWHFTNLLLLLLLLLLLHNYKHMYEHFLQVSAGLDVVWGVVCIFLT